MFLLLHNGRASFGLVMLVVFSHICSIQRRDFMSLYADSAIKWTGATTFERFQVYQLNQTKKVRWYNAWSSGRVNIVWPMIAHIDERHWIKSFWSTVQKMQITLKADSSSEQQIKIWVCTLFSDFKSKMHSECLEEIQLCCCAHEVVDCLTSNSIVLKPREQGALDRLHASCPFHATKKVKKTSLTGGDKFFYWASSYYRDAGIVGIASTFCVLAAHILASAHTEWQPQISITVCTGEKIQDEKK